MLVQISSTPQRKQQRKRVVFVTQGPAREASPLVYRLLTAYACTDSRLMERCEFVYFPIDQCAEPDPSALTTRAFAAAKAIAQTSADIIALSLYCWNTSHLLAIARFCKQLAPGVTIVVGGPDTYGEGINLLTTNPMIDVAIEGEGELGFRAVLQHYVLGEGDLADAPFAVHRVAGAIQASKNRTYVENLDDLPSPVLGQPRDALSATLYHGESASVILETARGCPVSCAFCQYPKSGRPMRYFGIERVLQELEHLRTIGVKMVYFGDGIFTLQHERALRIFQYFLQTFTDGALHVEIKLDSLPQQLVAACKELFDQGRLHFGIGLQSVNSETLKTMGRATKLHLLERNSRAIGNSRPNRWDLIYGLPGDCFADTLAGIDYINRVAPGALIELQPLQVLPGTEYRAAAQRLGIVYDPAPPYRLLESRTYSAADMKKAAVVGNLLWTFNRTLKVVYRHSLTPPSNLFRTLFTSDYFDYAEEDGVTPFTHLLVFGLRLRERALDAIHPDCRSVTSEMIDWVIVNHADALHHDERLAALPTHVPTRLAERPSAGRFVLANALDQAMAFKFSFDMSALLRADRIEQGSLEMEPNYLLLSNGRRHSLPAAGFQLLDCLRTPSSANTAIKRSRWQLDDEGFVNEVERALERFAEQGLLVMA